MLPISWSDGVQPSLYELGCRVAEAHKRREQVGSWPVPDAPIEVGE